MLEGLQGNYLGEFAQDSDEWHAVRAGGIGGSDIGTILGLNPYVSPYYLWGEKTGQIAPKELDSFAVTLGRTLEPVILDQLLPMMQPDWEIHRTGTWQHEEYPFMLANPDALAKIDGEWAVIEVKTSRNYWHEVPPHYRAQVLHYMNILGVKRGYICGLVGMDWVMHEIPFDEFEAKVIEQKAREFWQLVTTGTEPDFDGALSTYEAVREMHPEIDGSEIEIDGGHLLALAQQRFDEAEAELRKQKSEVMRLMGNAQHAYIEHEGKQFRVASRQARGGGKPFLVVNRGK